MRLILAIVGVTLRILWKLIGGVFQEYFCFCGSIIDSLHVAWGKMITWKVKREASGEWSNDIDIDSCR